MDSDRRRDARWQRRAMLPLLMLGLLVNSAGAQPPSPAAIVFESNVEYGVGGGAPLTLNIASPREAAGSLPCVVFIHGGGWQGGNKELHDAQVKELAARGFVAATVGYRFAPANRFPAQIEDCKCAIRFLRANAAEFKIDGQRIGAVGLSAGAHLAMLLGTMDAGDGCEGAGGSADQSSKVQAVVAFAGPTDLTASFPEVPAGIIDKLIGPQDSDSARAAALRRASPTNYVNHGDAAMLLFQGTKDPLIPTEQALEMAVRLTKAGVPGRVEVLIGAEHGWGEPDLTRTMNATYAFLEQQLRPARAGAAR